ncbi:diguanylate cyclase [Actinoplanes sp. NPDC049802]|uniref:sensor domain-containing diguanylate cyclase n=1 Tax=Actinoplanes sp. NPDC049802 TaxID=3154742 RepID=UPI0033D2FCEA
MTNFLTLDGSARTVMTLLDGATAVLLCLTALPAVVRGWPSARGEWLALLPVADSVVQVAVSGRLHYTTSLMLMLVGVGAAVTSRRIAASVGVAGVSGWIAVVLAAPHLRGPDLRHYGLQLMLSVVLGALLHEALRRRRRQLWRVHEQVVTVADRFERLFHASPAGVAIADGEGRVVAANPAFCELVGRPEAAVVGGSVSPYLAEDGAREGRHEIVRPDGGVRWAYLTIGHSDIGEPAECDRQRRSWTLIQLQDITDRHLAEEAVRDSHRLVAAVAAAARRIRTGEDARTTIIAAIRDLADAGNVSLLEPAECGSVMVVTGADGADVLGTRIPLDGSSMIARVYRSGEPLFLADPAQDARVSPSFLELVGAKSMLWQPVVVNGEVTAVLVVAWTRRVESVSDNRFRAVGLLADETALALEHDRLLRRLERMAFTDTLTGVPNRRAWQDNMTRLCREALDTGTPLTVAIADLDHFKRYNDTYGHAAGDELLQRAAEAFGGQLREGDFLARWGGEEFVIALPNSGPAEAVAVLDRLRAAVPDGQTCSIGCATWYTTESVEQLLQRADGALYAAKGDGRDRVRTAEVALTV